LAWQYHETRLSDAVQEIIYRNRGGGCEKIATGTFATADFPGFSPGRLGAQPHFFTAPVSGFLRRPHGPLILGVGLVQLTLQFLSDHWQFGWRFDTDPHRTSGDAHDGHRDVLADQNPFSDFAAEYEHCFACSSVQTASTGQGTAGGSATAPNPP
jgi:hypothetical protein